MENSDLAKRFYDITTHKIEELQKENALLKRQKRNSERKSKERQPDFDKLKVFVFVTFINVY